MNAIQIVRDTEQFPDMERIDGSLVNFYFDQASRPYGEGTQFMAVMVQVDYPQEEGKEDDLAEVKALALPAIKEYRIGQITAYDASSNVNCFYLGGNPMWLTVEEREQLATQISANESIGRQEMTKWFGGHKFTYTIAEWKQMLASLEVYAGDALNVTEEHKATVSAMRKADRVIEYDYTQGYPEKLSF